MLPLGTDSCPNFPQGRKKLKSEQQDRSRSRSPLRTLTRSMHNGRSSRSRSPTRATTTARRHHNPEPYTRLTPARTEYEYPSGDNIGGTYHHDAAHRQVHFTLYEKSDRDRGSAKYRRSYKMEDPADYYSEEYYMTDERRAKIDQIALGWEALQSSYPPLRLQ